MAKNDKKQSNSSIAKNIQTLMNNLATIGRSTNYSTFKIDKDLFDTETLLSDLESIQKQNEGKVKQTVEGTGYATSRINHLGLLGNSDPVRTKNGNVIKPEANDIFDVIKNNSEVFNELRQLMLMDNKLYETIADYEVLRRAIPQISRVIELIINSIITPEVITSESFMLKHNIQGSANKRIMEKIREKHELDQKIRIIVENYLCIGTEYITVVPYKAVIEAIKRNEYSIKGKKGIVKESALFEDLKFGSLTESADSTYNYLENLQIINESTVLNTFLEDLTEETRRKININRSDLKRENENFNKEINNFIKNINIYKSNKKLIYDSALVEAVKDDATQYMFESSFDELLRKTPKLKGSNDVSANDAAEGLVRTNTEYDKIKINGCKIERLDPARTYPVRIKDTVIAYVYIEERRDQNALQFNLQNSMRNTFSFYRMNTQSFTENMVKSMEDRMIREIGSRVIANISPKFVEANFENMDIFYEFLRDNSIHKEMRDIILIHPDDVIEFKRSKGSIMKNAVFFAKMYLLMVINNILTKVRRGSDRTIYYVNNGLSNDVEGSVIQAIEAIQQSEIRFSDLGSIAGIIGSVGSVVDLFIPQSSDAERPIQPEVIAGQTVEMDEEFLKFLIKSIILSFNVPSVVVDLTDEVEFAKTLSMANLDVANSSALAQGELNGPLTELIRRVAMHELDLTEEEVESIVATLIPSKSMLIQITNDLIETTKALGNSIAEVEYGTDEADTARKRRFVREFLRRNFTFDWADIDDIINKIVEDGVEEELETEMNNATDEALISGDATAAGGGDEWSS